MAKPTGAICNLDCSYCFYLDKASLYPGARFRMRDETMEAYVRQSLESQDAPEVTIAWQGGEPTLMGLAFFARMVETAERYRRPGQVIRHTLQTNATLLTDEWGVFLAEHRFLVGISIDGPPDLHDRFRVDKRGRPTSERVLSGLDVLRHHQVDYNVLCTVHAGNVGEPLRVYRYLRDDCGALVIQFIPIVEHQPNPDDPYAVSERSVPSAAWGDFLIAIFDEWVGRDLGEVYVQTFDAILAPHLGLPAGLCVFAETCGHAVALEHNGDVYSCDHFVDPAHRLGNLHETHLVELVGSDRQQRFGNEKRDSLPRYCIECEVRDACWGECPKNRFVLTPDGEEGLNYLCAGYKAFFTRVDVPLRSMAELIRSGRPAADLRTAIARAGRNDSCPCGSGLKTKRCHQRHPS
ncbi:MAG: anaerobic sulfatase maturase [Actinomycetota bacterium]|nr:anaerobic sulfatase maturase [Actinomycetota bacterium]